ncbi:ABC transporter ATP-binding protein [Latilactobacillus fragifolii]|uniref:ABC transporter ATP-binding protein n=1 Tax=Latilactobacillus fragifolii TaxID=2814244 RepID=UPI001ABB28A7|nr:ATP-binding cassette domain-containing protein [Latilactobacillus fragifolii]
MTQLKIEQLSYQVDQQVILTDINLTVETGSYLTITGPSGSGKSTLLRLIADLLPPTKGTIVLNDRPVTQFSPNQYRQKVSYCFQQATLFGETVGDNLRFPYEIRHIPVDMVAIEKALAAVGLIHMPLTKKITTLSGGEKQRIALIRNVLFPPEILLLDEITTGLDAANKAIVLAYVRHLNEDWGITMIAVTHDPEELQQKGRQVQIVAGELVNQDEFSR